MSMMSAPSAIMRFACANARSGVMNCPPSENESGVMLSTPITAGDGPDNSAGQARLAIEGAGGVVADVIAIMRSLCAVHASESRRERAYRAVWLSAGAVPRFWSVGNFGGKLARLGDQLLDRLFGWEDADE